jgi:hypothetical protein
MKRTLAHFLTLQLLLAILSTASIAQDRTQIPDPQPLQDNFPETQSLSDRSVWKLLVQQIGGFAGFNQSVVIDSTGVVSCSGFRVRCVTQIPTEAIDLLTQQIGDAEPLAWSGTAVIFACNDCLLHRITLIQRAPDETLVGHTATWSLTPAEASTGAGELHETVMRWPSLHRIVSRDMDAFETRPTLADVVVRAQETMPGTPCRIDFQTQQ